MGIWDKYTGRVATTMNDSETTYTPATEPPIQTSIDQNGKGRMSSDYTIHPPLIVEDDLRHSIAAYVRTSLDSQQKQRILAFTESVLAEILETEISQIVGPRFETLYEGVITEVVQKFLLKALAQRAQATMAQLTKE